MWDALMAFDRASMLFFQRIRLSWLDPVMEFFSLLGEAGAVWIALCLILLCFKKYRKSALIAGLSLLVCFLINNILLKNLIDRVRPYEVIEGLQVLGRIPGDASFPSGHACSSFATAHSLFLTRKGKYVWILYVLAGMITLSRIYVGVHYPTDLLVGVLVGLAGSTAVTKLLTTKVKFFTNV